MKKILMMSLCALAVASGVAIAGDHEGGKHGFGEKKLEHMFTKNDTDGDGAVSKEEFLASAEKKFTAMDKDGDGKITKEEAKTHHEEMRAKWQAKKGKMDKPEGEKPVDAPAEPPAAQ